VIRAVLDTNVVASGILIRNGISSRIVDAAYARVFACASSAPIVAEVVRTFGRERVRRKYRIAPADLDRVRRFLESDLVSVQLTTRVSGVATHPEDDLVLATALSASADYLVTGDRQLQQLQHFRGVIIVSPRQFLALLVASAAEHGA
jgi:uncharacterized protein